MSIGYCHYCDASMGHRPTCPTVTGETVPALQRRIAELEAQLAECQKDAERYRWLCRNANAINHKFLPHIDRQFLNNTDWLNASVDAAIKENGK